MSKKLAYRVIEVKAGENRAAIESQHYTEAAAKRAAEKYDQMLRAHAPTALIRYAVKERQEDGSYEEIDWQVGE